MCVHNFWVCLVFLNWQITWKRVIWVVQLFVNVEIPHTNVPFSSKCPETINNWQKIQNWIFPKKQELNKPDIKLIK